MASSPAYGPKVTVANGTTIELFARQRPQLLFASDEAGADLLAVVNGAELANGRKSLMQGKSFTLIQPIVQK